MSKLGHIGAVAAALVLLASPSALADERDELRNYVLQVMPEGNADG